MMRPTLLRAIWCLTVALGLLVTVPLPAASTSFAASSLLLAKAHKKGHKKGHHKTHIGRSKTAMPHEAAPESTGTSLSAKTAPAVDAAGKQSPHATVASSPASRDSGSHALIWIAGLIVIGSLIALVVIRRHRGATFRGDDGAFTSTQAEPLSGFSSLHSHHGPAQGESSKPEAPAKSRRKAEEPPPITAAEKPLPAVTKTASSLDREAPPPPVRSPVVVETGEALPLGAKTPDKPEKKSGGMFAAAKASMQNAAKKVSSAGAGSVPKLPKLEKPDAVGAASAELKKVGGLFGKAKAGLSGLSVDALSAKATKAATEHLGLGSLLDGPAKPGAVSPSPPTPAPLPAGAGAAKVAAPASAARPEPSGPAAAAEIETAAPDVDDADASSPADSGLDWAGWEQIDGDEFWYRIKKIEQAGIEGGDDAYEAKMRDYGLRDGGHMRDLREAYLAEHPEAGEMQVMMNATTRVSREKMQQAADPKLFEPINGVSLEVYSKVMARRGNLPPNDPAALAAVYAEFGVDEAQYAAGSEGWQLRMKEAGSDPYASGALMTKYAEYFAAGSQSRFAVAAQAGAASADYENLDGVGAAPAAAEPVSYERFVEIQVAQKAWSQQGKDIGENLRATFDMSIMDYSAISQFWSAKFQSDVSRYFRLEAEYRAKYEAEYGVAA